jgi:transposase
VLPGAWTVIDDGDSGLPEALRAALADVCQEICDLEGRIRSVERQLEALAEQTPAVGRARSLALVSFATGLVAFVGDIQRFPSARHLASASA